MCWGERTDFSSFWMCLDSGDWRALFFFSSFFGRVSCRSHRDRVFWGERELIFHLFWMCFDSGQLCFSPESSVFFFWPAIFACTEILCWGETEREDNVWLYYQFPIEKIELKKSRTGQTQITNYSFDLFNL